MTGFIAPFVPKGAADLYLESFPADAIIRHEKDAEPYVSPAQVKMFARCPEQFRNRYLLGRKERPSAALLWGSADHATFEANFRQKLVSHKDMSVADIQTMFAADLDERVERDGGAGEVEWEKGVVLTGDDAKKAHAVVKDGGVRLVTVYHERVCPSVQPTAVEESFTVAGPGLGIPVDLKGRIDLRALVPDIEKQLAFIPGTSEPVTIEKIIDRKTSGSKKKINASPEWVTAARIYQLGEHYSTGTAHPVEYHLSLKPGKRRKTPDVVANDPDMVIDVVPAAMVAQQVRQTIVGISFMYSTYGPDDPWPGAWAGFASSCDYCGFRPDCAWWHGARWDKAAA